MAMSHAHVARRSALTASVLAADPPPSKSPPASLPPAWLAGPVADDAAASPEVIIDALPANDFLARSIVIERSTEPGGIVRRRVVARRNLAAGELVLAELSVASVVDSQWRALCERPVRGADGASAGSDGDVWSNHIRLTGPFQAAPGAAVRVLRQMALGFSVPDSALTRKELFASVFQRCALSCTCLAGNPYASKSGGSNSVAAASAGALHHALFSRACLLGHSCDANAGYRSTFDVHANAPAIHVFASRPIAAGEEITVSLCDPVADTLTRGRALRDRKYGETSTSTETSPACACPRCSSTADDAVALRCQACAEGVWAPGAAACSRCGATCPAANDLYAVRAAALRAVTEAGDDAASLTSLSAVLHDWDAGAFALLHASLPVLIKGGDDSSAALLSLRLVAAAERMPYFPAPRLLELLVQNALVCGYAARPEDSAASWLRASSLATAYHATFVPQLIEAYAAFARKPSRNRAEAAMADRMIQQLMSWQ